MTIMEILGCVFYFMAVFTSARICIRLKASADNHEASAKALLKVSQYLTKIVGLQETKVTHNGHSATSSPRVVSNFRNLMWEFSVDRETNTPQNAPVTVVPILLQDIRHVLNIIVQDQAHHRRLVEEQTRFLKQVFGNPPPPPPEEPKP